MQFPILSGFDQQAFRKYFRNTTWLLFGKTISLLSGLLVARYLGPASFGDLSFVLAFIGLFAGLSTLGLDSLLLRELIQNPRNQYEMMGTACFMRLAMSLLLVPICMAAYSLFYNSSALQAKSLIIPIGLCAAAYLFKSLNVIDSYFQSQVQSKFVVQVQNLGLCISTVTKLLFMVFNLPLIYFSISFLADSMLLAIGLVFIYHQKGFRLDHWKFNRQRAKSMLDQSWPLMLTALMIAVYMQIDQIMLKQFGGNQVVGIYSAAARISEAWYFIPVAIVTSVFPAIMHARQTDIHRYEKRLQNLYDLLIAISLPIALSISLFANTIINLLYGNPYEAAGLMLSIHIWSGVFVFLGTASSQYLLAEGYTRISLMRTAFGALTNIICNLWLIPLYAGIGASIATLLAYFVATFSILLFSKTRQQGFNMLKSLFLISLLQKTRMR